jgi:hypothetical protein
MSVGDKMKEKKVFQKHVYVKTKSALRLWFNAPNRLRAILEELLPTTQCPSIANAMCGPRVTPEKEVKETL